MGLICFLNFTSTNILSLTGLLRRNKILVKNTGHKISKSLRDEIIKGFQISLQVCMPEEEFNELPPDSSDGQEVGSGTPPPHSSGVASLLPNYP